MCCWYVFRTDHWALDSQLVCSFLELLLRWLQGTKRRHCDVLKMTLLLLMPWFMECCINTKREWESISTAPTERIHPSVFFTSKKSCVLSLWLKTDFNGSHSDSMRLYLLCVYAHLCSVHVQIHVFVQVLCMCVESRQQPQVSFFKQHRFVFWDRVSRWLGACQVV